MKIIVINLILIDDILKLKIMKLISGYIKIKAKVNCRTAAKQEILPIATTVTKHKDGLTILQMPTASRK